MRPRIFIRGLSVRPSTIKDNERLHPVGQSVNKLPRIFLSHASQMWSALPNIPFPTILVLTFLLRWGRIDLKLAYRKDLIHFRASSHSHDHATRMKQNHQTLAYWSRTSKIKTSLFLSLIVLLTLSISYLKQNCMFLILFYRESHL